MAYCDSIPTFCYEFFKSILLDCVCQVPTFHSVEVGRNFFSISYSVHICRCWFANKNNTRAKVKEVL